MERHATSKASTLLARVRDGDEGTLNTTAIVHEVFIRLMGQGVLELRDRGHSHVDRGERGHGRCLRRHREARLGPGPFMAASRDAGG